MQQQTKNIFQWLLRIIAAVMMLQTLYFKFSGSEESVYIFTQMGIEPWGRYATGIAELIAALLILYKPAISIGAILTLGIMSGAIFSHLFVLGIAVKNDHGLLFTYAITVWVAASILLWLNRYQLRFFFQQIFLNKQG
ncbi:MAG TPA: DoxX family protein [Chitinophagaceae bacterium]|nr:DoxX family protein [Chitinophagaceae bacterium]